MITAAKPLPEHGTYARANGVHGQRRPCNCDACRPVRLRTRKRNKVNRQLGRPAHVPATLAQAHLKTLNQTMTWPQIGALAGCDHGHLGEIANGHVTTIRRTTQDKILALRPQDSAPNKFVDATGTTRRIQGLRALGYSPAFIAKAFGFAETHVRHLSRGERRTVRHRIAVKVAAVTAELATIPAPPGASATMARNHARACGWVPLAAWDDIDDPMAKPDLGDAPLNMFELAALRREEIIHLAWCGHTPEQILVRLNDEVSISTVRAVVQEWRTGQKRIRKQVAA